ncbi:hypothetical protein ES703_108151 [subsurface metagenome]
MFLILLVRFQYHHKFFQLFFDFYHLRIIPLNPYILIHFHFPRQLVLEDESLLNDYKKVLQELLDSFEGLAIY